MKSMTYNVTFISDLGKFLSWLEISSFYEKMLNLSEICGCIFYFWRWGRCWWKCKMWANLKWSEIFISRFMAKWWTSTAGLIIFKFEQIKTICKLFEQILVNQNYLQRPERRQMCTNEHIGGWWFATSQLVDGETSQLDDDVKLVN